MNQSVWHLGQQLMAAAWEAARRVEDPDAQASHQLELLTWVQETEAQLAGLRMELLGEAQLAGATAVVDHARNSTRNTTQRAGADLRLASALAEFPLISQAMQEGTISLAQAEGMVTGLNKLPARLTREQWRQAQHRLLTEAAVLGPNELRFLAIRILELIDPEIADEEEAKRLAREQRRARITRKLRISSDFHGSMRISGQLPVADGALLQAQLEALLPPVSSYSEDELGTMEMRRADALILLSQLAAATGELPDHGMDRPQVHITMSLDGLTTAIGDAALLGHAEAERLTAGEARRLACDAGIIPMVLGGQSQPLDVGRTHRLVPRPLRAALTHRDQGCTFPHCTAPAPACEAHHIRPWWAGGDTSLANTVLLCPRHHRLVEPDPQQSEGSQWQAELDEATGLPRFIPPRYIDPSSTPRQHRRLRLATLKLLPDEAGVRPDGEIEDPKPPPRPELDPQDDPWHPDYLPPPRVTTPTPVAAEPQDWPVDDPWHPYATADDG